MTPRYHPSDAILLDYAAGALDEGRSVLVATHLQYCPSCRRRLVLLDALGGALLEELPPEPVTDSLMRDTLDRLDAVPQDAAPRQPRPATGFPTPLDGRLRALGGVSWQSVAPGVHQMKVADVGASGHVRLMHLDAGASVPHHAHAGTELTLVLTGGFHDRFGHYAPGDVVEAGGSDDHTPIADPEGCVCLLATEGPLVFSALLPPRLAAAWTSL